MICYEVMDKRPDHLILFDPYCRLCSAAVRYVIKKDRKKLFHYGSLYSKRGKFFKKVLPWKQQKNTIIYFEQEKVFTQSDAVIRIIAKLKGIHRLVIVFKFLPKGFRDYIYRIIAKYRYRLFGKMDDVFVHVNEERELFVDYGE